MEIALKNLQKKISIPQGPVIKAAQAALRKLKGVNKARCLSIVFVGPKRMRAINKKYLEHDYVTDVLTFDLGKGVAEIIICPLMARVNARVCQTTTGREIILYVIHGILHLAGFDDHRPKDIIRMRRMERELLK
ncbi:MAG: rRNA maturation RNase YbeY [Candidatus Omnitrophica bacterium]|nr:rRNA maturation RNase YbeY [Candidatus Omnitrophota bacterium]